MNVEKQIEFLLQNQADHDARLGKLTENVKEVTAAVHSIINTVSHLGDLYEKNQLMLSELMRAVASHERRLAHLE